MSENELFKMYEDLDKRLARNWDSSGLDKNIRQAAMASNAMARKMGAMTCWYLDPIFYAWYSGWLARKQVVQLVAYKTQWPEHRVDLVLADVLDDVEHRFKYWLQGERGY